MTTGPDFLRPVARPGVLAWAWCATGLLVLAVAVADAAVAWAGRQQSLQALQVSNRPAAALPTPARRDGRSAGAPPDARAAQQAAAQRWLQQLAHPWPQAWAASELVSEPGIAWLALEHSVQGALRLEGLAPDEGLAQQAARSLRDVAGPAGPLWQQVALVRTERVTGGQRFEITAQRRLDPVAAETTLPAAPTAPTAATREATPTASSVAAMPLSSLAAVPAPAPAPASAGAPVQAPAPAPVVAVAVAMAALVDGGSSAGAVR